MKKPLDENTPMAYSTAMLILETSVFTKRISDCMSEDVYRELQSHLISNPGAGDIILGGGGLRKIRWAGSGRGKRGGTRVIYYWWVPDQLMMLFAYKKNEASDLTPSQVKQLRLIVEEWLHEKE
jgi:mRNA-degrading endonuclease RelE of RelBE toxin-antitoxin system